MAEPTVPTAGEIPLHPLALKILDRVEVGADAAAAAIPPAVLVKVRQRLGQHKDDRPLFVHLVVLRSRLLHGGLVTAAAQLLELARIGLGEALAQTIERVESSKEAQKTIRAPVAGRNPTSGLAAAAPLSVGLRPKPKR